MQWVSWCGGSTRGSGQSGREPVGRGKQVYLDAYSGAVLGPGSQGMRSVMSTLRGWHRWFNFTGDRRALGRAVTGAANLMFLFIVISGLYLWFPRIWTWTRIRRNLLFKRGVRGRAFDFNWHHVWGFWTAIPLVVVVGSATVISYRWASDLSYRVVGEAPPVRGQPSASDDVEPIPPNLARLDALMIPASEQLADWRTIRVTVPEDGGRPVTFRIDEGNGRQPQKQHTMAVDPNTGQIASWEPFESRSRGRRLRSYLRFAHTGEVWGVVGQTIAGIASLAGAILVWTGLMLALRRLVLDPLRRGRRRRAVPETIEPAEEREEAGIAA